MDYPLFLPEYLHLSHKEVLSLPLLDRITFLQAALGDETWCEEHLLEVKDLLQRFTEEVFYDHIDSNSTQTILKAIREKYRLIESVIEANITVNNTPINSLIFGGSSPYFQEKIRRECREANQASITLPDISPLAWEDMVEFMKTGAVHRSWTKPKEELIKEHAEVIQVQLDGLAEACEQILKRYIDASNLVETLLFSHEKKMKHLRRICQEKINDTHVGVRLLDTPITEFPFEFLDFKDRAKALFDRLHTVITHLVAGYDLPEDAYFIEAMLKTPKLVGVDVSGSYSFTENLLSIPSQVRELQLSMCAWLTHANLHEIATASPQIQRLTLTSNSHLNYLFWSEISRFKALRYLNVSRCHQITDEDFQILLGSCQAVGDFAAEECTRLSGEAFFEIPRLLPNLFSLNLSRCQVTDSAALEIVTKAPHLTFLYLNRCPLLSEKGMIEMARLGKKLKELHFSGNRLSETALETIRKVNPYVTIK